jgi:hypothetical protein
LVFTSTHRRSPFTDEIPRRCEEITRSARADFGTERVEFNSERLFGVGDGAVNTRRRERSSVRAW